MEDGELSQMHDDKCMKRFKNERKWKKMIEKRGGKMVGKWDILTTFSILPTPIFPIFTAGA